MSGWNLPPGCTDADIDRAANGDESDAVQCDCCGKMFRPDEITFVPFPNAAGCDTYICERCLEEARNDPVLRATRESQYGPGPTPGDRK